MKTINISEIERKTFKTFESAKEEINSILNFSGVKEEEKIDKYANIFNLQKQILNNAGYLIYQIWIKQHYNEKWEKQFYIYFSVDYSMSMTIKPYIKTAEQEGIIILTDEMKEKLTAIETK